MARYLGYDYYPFNDPRLKNQQTNMIANGWKRKKGAYGAAPRTGIGYDYLCEKDHQLKFHCSMDWINAVLTKITKSGCWLAFHMHSFKGLNGVEISIAPDDMNEMHRDYVNVAGCATLQEAFYLACDQYIALEAILNGEYGNDNK